MTFKLISIALFLEISLSSCARYTNYGPVQLLVLSEPAVTYEMIEAAKSAAKACGLTDIIDEYRDSGSGRIYFVARAKNPSVQIFLENDVQHERIAIYEDQEDRNDNDGFSESAKKQFVCFESELSKSSLNTFKIVPIPPQPH